MDKLIGGRDLAIIPYSIASEKPEASLENAAARVDDLAALTLHRAMLG